MARNLKAGSVYVLIGLFLLLVARGLTLAVDQAIRLISLYRVSSHAGGPDLLTDTPTRVRPLPTPSMAPAAATSPAPGVRLVGHIGGTPQAVFGQGNTIYLGIGAELGILDVSDPTHPTQVAFFDLPNPTHFDGIAVSNGTVYAGAGAAGLYILQYSSGAD